MELLDREEVMNKLPQVFLILTVIGLGVSYGHHNYVATSDGGSSQKHIRQQIHKSPAVRDAEIAKAAPRLRQGKQDAPDSTRTAKPQTKQTKPLQQVENSEKARLNTVDALIATAAFYATMGEMDVEERAGYARKVLELTEDALDILEPIWEKHRDDPELEERMKAINQLRHDAVKNDDVRD
jgi:hypothetical protein